jgi:arylsulfatase A-like enzyme
VTRAGAAAEVRRRLGIATVYAIGAALLLAGCNRPASIELTERAATAELLLEHRTIDFGTAAAREALRSGWDRDDQWGDGTTIVWGVGRESSLTVYVATPRPITLRARCWSLPYPDLPPQTVTVAVNDVTVGSLVLQAWPDEYAVQVPAAVLQPGRNAIDLTYAYARRPIDLDPHSPDTRPLAVAWDWLTFDGLTDAARPERAGTDRLLIPHGSEIGFYLDLPPDSSLELGDASTGPFEIAIDSREGPSRVVSAPGGRGGRRAIALPNSGLTRIAFRNPAVMDDGVPPATVIRPALRVAAAPATADAACAALGALRRRAPRPHVIVYVIDALRPDYLGCYGYARPTSPRIDAFAREAVRFTHATAQASWTKPAVASIFTGCPPPQHGATGLRSVMRPLPTMASLLSAAGYDSAAFVTNGFVGTEYGLGRGFATHVVLAEHPVGADEGVDAGPDDVIHQRAETLQRTVFDWLDARHSTAPLLLYLHASDPHAPYLPPPRFRERFAPGVPARLGLLSSLDRLADGPLRDADRAAVEALYDGEVAYADEQFGAFLDGLRARGLYDDALIILLADHGESFGEHGFLQHGSTLFQPQIAIPLIVKLPGRSRDGTVVDDPVQQIDLLPTVLALTGVAAPEPLRGSSLLAAALCASALPPTRAVYSQLGGDGFSMSLESVSIGTRKLVRDRLQHVSMLYDLGSDPGELHDLAAARPLRSGYLLSIAREIRTAGELTAPPPAAADSALLERLRALGYGGR